MNSNIILTELEKTILNRINYYINQDKRVNIETIASDCFVSKGAVIKLSKKLGFSGYSEMYYVTLASRKKSSLVNFSGSMNEFKNNQFKMYIDMITEVLWHYRDSKIYIDSLGTCDAARDYYLQKLLVFGFNASTCYHYEAFHVDKPGVYIFISFSGSNSIIIDKVKVAIENGFNVIALTSNPNSPLAKLANYTIIVDGIKTEKENYEPNLFTANLIILFELVLSNYSKQYLKREIE